jgi:hypothetical protein
MTRFGWEALAVGLAGALGTGFIAMTVLARRRTRRLAEPARGLGSGRRRIDVVAIDSASGRSLEKGSQMTPEPKSQPETLSTETTKERS